jgi:hypothetical protein
MRRPERGPPIAKTALCTKSTEKFAGLEICTTCMHVLDMAKSYMVVDDRINRKSFQ